MNDINNVFQVLRVLAIHLPSGIAVPVLIHVPMEKAIVISIPIAMEIYDVALIIACSIMHIVMVAHGRHQQIVARMPVSRMQTL